MPAKTASCRTPIIYNQLCQLVVQTGRRAIQSLGEAVKAQVKEVAGSVMGRSAFDGFRQLQVRLLLRIGG